MDQMGVIQLSLVDILLLTAAVCFVIVAFYLVKALKTLIRFLGTTEKLMEEATVLTEDIQSKSKAIDEAVGNSYQFIKRVAEWKK